MTISDQKLDYTVATAPISVIVADDHSMISECICSFLETRINGTVSSQSTFQGAWDAATLKHCDVILLDMVMPGMDGVASIERLVAAFPETKVVIFSSCADQSLVVKAIKAGARGFIPKDMPLSALVPALNLILSGEIFFPSSFFKSAAFEKLSATSSTAVLNPSEIAMLEMVLVGASNKEIGHRINQSENNVKMLMRKAFLKLGANNRTHAVHIAQSNGWI
jgi:two-component system nitrate/nitrite response regulator NarP